MSKLYLQNIIDDISFDKLPAKWQGFDYARFSKDKTLFDFQKQGLKNALKALWFYYKEKDSKNANLYSHYKANGFEEKLDYDLKKKGEGKTARFLLEYDKSYPVLDSKISFEYFINRMSFWMATGSGKTLLIVKLIEILGKLISEKEIPANDILFLAHRDDLLEQFKNHVEEFNSFNFDAKINLKSLRDYESVKRENVLPFAKNEITVFYYRSDLISDEHKEKLINFRNYDNNGKWYILLDEAHKGDREDSKRQILYSILSRNGFLFNFSATFTDPRDYATCAFNFNLSRFIEEGYGKHIYVSQSEISAFRDKTDFSPIEKQKIVLKTLILLTYINKYFEKVRKVNTLSAFPFTKGVANRRFDGVFADTPLQEGNLYHRPLLLTLVNSVNKPDADLQLFFAELEKIAKEEPNKNIFSQAKEEFAKEFENNPTFYFEDNERVNLNIEELRKIEYKDILKHVFNSNKSGAIEVSFRPSDKKQAAFKLATSDRHFALIKTGDMPEWLKNELERFNINHRFETEGFFETINRDDSDINVLMGSRAFYEGWDSNRPNLILFVNIGVGSDAKKFVLQSVGRGVRIEPQKNKRRRLQNLFNAKEIEFPFIKGWQAKPDGVFNKIQKLILPIESLFVFGTNAENLKEIIKTLKEEKQDKDLGGEFIINKEAEKHLLLVPVYKDSEKIFAEEKEPQQYPISKEDLDLTKRFYEFLGDKVSLAKYECEVKVLIKAKESLEDAEKYYDFSEKRSLFEPELILDRVFDYFGVKSKEFDKFKKLEEKIVHFKKIRFSDGEKFDQILKKMQQVKNYEQKEGKIKQLRLDLEKHKDIEKYDKEKERIDREYQKEVSFEKLKIKYVQNHHYIPLVISESEKVNYLNHIINVDSEVKFIEQLEGYVVKPDNILSQFDWWMFSKLDGTLDEVYIPYYNPKENNIANFKPDFIFWMQKGNRYIILFVDPKGTEHADGYRKIDGYSKIFETKEGKESKDFSFNGFNINTKLLLKPTRGIAEVLENYRRYWFDNFGDFASKIK